MRIVRHVLSSLLFTSGLTVVACSSSDESLGQQEAADTLRPVDSETLGYVLVQRPSAGAVLGFTVKVDGAAATPDKPLRVIEGTHVLSLEHDGADWGKAERPDTLYRRIDVKRKQTTTVKLAALSLSFSKSDRNEGDLNVLPEPVVDLTVNNAPFPSDCAARSWECRVRGHNMAESFVHGVYATSDACKARCHGFLAERFWCAQPFDRVCDQPEVDSLVRTTALDGIWSGSSPSAVALLEGKYIVTTPAGTTDVELASGAYQSVSIPAAQLTRGSLVVTPQSREMPTATDARLLIKLNGDGRNSTEVDVGSAHVVTAVGFASTDGNGSARLGPRTIPLSFRDKKKVALNLGRIDVDDVLVHRENGTSYSAQGIYKVTCTTDGTTIGSFSTHTGIDVLPGDYRVDLSYSTEEGPRSQTFQLHF